MGGPLLVVACAIAVVGGLAAIVGLMVTAPSGGAEARLESLSAGGTSLRKSNRRSNRTLVHPQSKDGRSHSTSGGRLVQAGFYRRSSTGMYVAVKILFALVPVGIGIGAGLMHWVTMTQGCFIGVVLGLVGTILPGFWLDAQKRQRQTKISRALPDALDVIVVCVEAGLSVPGAIARVSSELQSAYPLLAAEMLIVQREIQLGLTTGQALQQFADRFDLSELRGLASVVKQAEKFGASIAKALRVHAETMRVKRFQLAEEKAQKATVKLLFPTLFCIFPALYVVLIGPAVYDIIALFQRLANR